jgi:hypothetical protein
MAQKKVNRVPAHSPMPVQSPVYNTPHSRVADVERKRSSSRNKFARKTPARTQVDYERGIDRDRDTSDVRRRHQNPQFSDMPADSTERRGRGGAGAAGGKSRRAAEKKKKLPLFMRMQEKAREEEERLERDKVSK